MTCQSGCSSRVAVPAQFAERRTCRLRACRRPLPSKGAPRDRPTVRLVIFIRASPPKLLQSILPPAHFTGASASRSAGGGSANRHRAPMASGIAGSLALSVVRSRRPAGRRSSAAASPSRLAKRLPHCAYRRPGGHRGAPHRSCPLVPKKAAPVWCGLWSLVGLVEVVVGLVEVVTARGYLPVTPGGWALPSTPGVGRCHPTCGR